MSNARSRARLAHELRGSLATLRNAAQVLSAPNTDAATRQKAHDLLSRQIDAMTRLIDELEAPDASPEDAH